MKKDGSISGNWKIVIFLLAGSLVYAGFTQILLPSSVEQLKQGPLKLQLDPIRQLKSTSCGEAVIAMVYNYAYPQTPINEQEVIDYAVSEGYYTEELSPYTSPADMLRIAKYYEKDISTGKVSTSKRGLELLIQNLHNGDPVIIDVLSNFNDPQSEAHFIVITGVSLDPNRENVVVIDYNDPLTGTAESADWAGETGVWNAWQTNTDPGGSGWWLVLHTPE
jgi:hypothetical protein